MLPYENNRLYVGADSISARFFRNRGLRCLCHGDICGVQHIFNENSVPRGGIVDQNVGYSTDELAVLNDGAARHECGQ